MTDLLSVPDRDAVLVPPPGLAELNALGVLTAADVHVARALAEITGETDDEVVLAAALACRAVRAGSVCVDLTTLHPADLVAGEAEDESGPVTATAGDLPWPADATDWLEQVRGSRMVAAGVLRVDHDLLYLDRYHEQETQVLDDLAVRSRTSPDHDAALMVQTLDRVFPDASYAEQRAACLRAASQWTTVITGGPGTGKTTSVAGLLVALHDLATARGESIRVALTAPTGKAAARLQESLATARLGEADRAKLAGVEAMTIHRLLRTDPGNRTRFRHHRANRLPHDVVVVDETSMVSLTLMARLLEAVRPDARLVLVGDPHQLSSVEAGAVLSDLVRGYESRPDSPVAALRTTRRFGEHIGALADAIRDGDADRAIEVLSAGHDEVRWVTDASDPSIRGAALATAVAVRDRAAAGDAAGALAALARHRLLCAHRDGPYGAQHWNRRIEGWLSAEVGEGLHDPAYVGRPLLVNANDHALKVYNGDAGVVVVTPEGRRVALPGPGGEIRLLAPSRLGDVSTMHAMTIHKAQGSQAEQVTVLLPDEESRLLTRELLYTAVTRAEKVVTVVGEEAWVRAAIERRAQRASGLAVRLAPDA
jgi:exodeoxyribonuclease V alpha subunit